MTMKPDYVKVLAEIRPKTLWRLSGDDYSGLEWLDDSPKPTKKTLDDAWPEIERQEAIDAVRAERARLYREETDGMFFEAQRGEGTVNLDQWKAAVQAIKDAHPWPS